MLNIKINEWMARDLMYCERYVVIAVEDADNWWIYGSDSTIEGARKVMANERLDDPEGELDWYIISPWGTLEEKG